MKLVSLGRGLTLTSEATTGTAFPGVVYRPIQQETFFRNPRDSRGDRLVVGLVGHVTAPA